MTVTIRTERVWQSLMDMARIGETPKGGVNRIAFSELDRTARDLFRRWAEDAGCTVRVDPFGNMFARRAGQDPDAPVVMAGSHLDSQPTGGKFDGALGVLGALEAVRAFNEAKIETTHPIDIVNWTNEEGCLFQPMVGSAVWTGLLDLDEALAMRDDREGWSIAEGLARIGYDGNADLMGAEPVACYLELHIEQGPILEQAGQSIGVVEATQGQHWYDLTLIGQEAHAGPTPMSSRRDALMGMSRIALAADEISREEPPGCATVGRVEVFPNSPNTIPGRVMFSCDLRHPDRQKLTRMDQHFRDRAAEISGDMNLTLELSQRVYIPPMPFNVPLADAVADAAQQVGEPWRRMYTGAGHDACNVARHLPTAMVFIPCRDGISHNEAEHAEPEHVAAGVQVLATTLLAAANGEINFAS